MKLGWTLLIIGNIWLATSNIAIEPTRYLMLGMGVFWCIAGCVAAWRETR